MSDFDPNEVRAGTGRFIHLSGAGQFVSLARSICATSAGASGEANWQAIAAQSEGRPDRQLIADHAKAAMIGSALWETAPGNAMTAAYLSEVAPANLVDAVAQYATPIPTNGARVFIASGVVAEGVAEGAKKPVTPLALDLTETERAKVAAILVLSEEAATMAGPIGDKLFRKLLREAVIRASNAAMLAALPRAQVAAGSSAVDSLRVGLAAAADSTAYVVAARGDVCRELALASDGRMGIDGGEFTPGVTVIRAEFEGTAPPDLIVIPAANIAIRDWGLDVRSVRHATVEMTNSEGEETPFGLWQHNCIGIICERLVDIVSENVVAVEVG